MNIVVMKLAHVLRAIVPLKGTKALLPTFLIDSFILGVVTPDLDSKPMLFVFHPTSYILRTIHMFVSSIPVGLIINPITLIHITIRVNQPALPVGFISSPISRVLCTVLPNLSAPSLTMASLFAPLSEVDGTIIQFHRPLIFKRILVFRFLIQIKIEDTESIFGRTGEVIRVIWHLFELLSFKITPSTIGHKSSSMTSVGHVRHGIDAEVIPFILPESSTNEEPSSHALQLEQ